MKIVKNKIYYDTFMKEYYVAVDILNLSSDIIVLMRRLNDKEVTIFSLDYVLNYFKSVPKLKEILLYESEKR